MSDRPQSQTAHAQDATPNVRRMTVVRVVEEAEKCIANGQPRQAIALYRDWIALSSSPMKHLARYNLARLLSDHGERIAAINQYEAALREKPTFSHARVNLGFQLEMEHRLEEGIGHWQRALQDLESTQPLDRDTLRLVLNNLGRVFEKERRHVDAEAMLRRSLAVDPGQREVLYHWIRQRQFQCAWPIYSPLPGVSLQQMEQATSALSMLGITDDSRLQREAAGRSVAAMVQVPGTRLAPLNGYRHQRLRVGYLSSNFGEHAVSILTAELYELHDRSRVEVWGFCWSPEDSSAMRERVRHAFDRFVLIGSINDEQAARLIRTAEIDVLVDLQGLTAGARPNILAWRPAPVQITWLGHPGPTALPGIDFVLCDRYVIPEAEAAHYPERPMYLPDCFQINDRKRQAGPPSSRERYGLPAEAFVFCAFNHNHKFTPEWFTLWMRILQACPNSVLWLLGDNETSERNLNAAAAAQGIDSNRLVFAPRVLQPEYLARLALADLFLDCFPFNGGTTASDALWMGLPVLTRSGRSFASRMAGSLLHAIGLPELVTQSDEDYVATAIHLAGDVEALARLRQRLVANREVQPLFDTPRFVRNLEDLFEHVSRDAAGADAAVLKRVEPAPVSTERQVKQTALRLAIYTVLIGDKEALCDPREALPPQATSDLELDFVCFTDNPALVSPTWRFVLLDSAHLPPEKLSRRPKALPHEYFPDSEHSLYIDNTVTLKRLPTRVDLEPLDGPALRVFAHPSRSHPGEEAEAVLLFGYEEVATLCAQLDFYRQQLPIESLAPLSSGTVILRRHHAPEVRRFGQIWWEQILAFSRRDQISLDFAAARAGCPRGRMAGSKLGNDLFTWMTNAAGVRVKANFDSKRYAWLHRDDEAARAAPKAHFLAQGGVDEARYARRIDVFDYICHKHGSSLGTQVSPRRGVSTELGDALSVLRGKPGRLLVVRIIDETDVRGCDASELAPAGLALATLLQGFSAHTLEFVTSELDAAPFGGISAADAFALLLVIGCPPTRIEAALRKLAGLAAIDTAVIAVITTGEGDLDAIARARQPLSERTNAAVQVRVAPSFHDACSTAIANSLCLFSTGRVVEEAKSPG